MEYHIEMIVKRVCHIYDPENEEHFQTQPSEFYHHLNLWHTIFVAYQQSLKFHTSVELHMPVAVMIKIRHKSDMAVLAINSMVKVCKGSDKNDL